MPSSSSLPEAQYIDISDLSQQGYATGANWGTTDFYEGMRDFQADFRVYDDAELKDAIQAIDDSGEGWLERRIRKIKDQGREGTCTYNMLGGMAEVTGNKQWGDDSWIELSPVSGYHWNANGPNSGSSVPGALNWILGTGLLPARTEANLQLVSEGKFAHTHPSTGYYEKFQSGWQTTSKLFRADEFLRLTTVNAWLTALVMGFPCGGGRDSHAIFHCRPLFDSGSFLSLYANSWGEDWGSTYAISPLSGNARGFGADSERKIATMVARGAFCLCTMLVPPWHRSLAA